jgi:hypothetical protein
MEVTKTGWVNLQNNIQFLEEPKDPYNRENNSSKYSRNANASSETTLFGAE